MMNKLILGSCFLILVILVVSGYSYAAPNGRFKQSIVPLDCYLDAVNTGTGQHLYIAPEDCEKAPEVAPLIPVSPQTTTYPPRNSVETESQEPVLPRPTFRKATANILRAWTLADRQPLLNIMVSLGGLFVLGLSWFAWQFAFAYRSKRSQG